MSSSPTSARIWVSPNRNTIGLLSVVAAMWYAGASQNNGAAYLLCFVLSGVAIISTLHTWTNLRGILIENDAVRPVFAGEECAVTLHARSVNHHAHFGVRVTTRGASRPALIEHVPAEGDVSASLHFTAGTRGVFPELELKLESRFPLGFFSARQKVVLRSSRVVYPATSGARALPVSLLPTRHSRDGLRAEGEDFGGVRAWRVGESQRHIDWKAAARGQPLLIKQWAGDAEQAQVFTWEMLPDVDVETRLQQLARWIVIAEAAGTSYGLNIPAFQRAPARGEAHYHACLRALAQFADPVAAALSADTA